MFQDNPVFSLLSLGVAAWLFSMWADDLRHFRKTGDLRRGAFEGATPAPFGLVAAGVVAALALLAVNTCAELAAGVESDQTKVAPWALLSWVGAAFVEELIFRGYLVVKNRGRAALVGSIFLFSFLFAAGHPFLWDYTVPEGASVFGGTWTFDFSAQPLINTLAVFECSLLFYALRFVPQNKTRSLLPCVCAHAAYNCGVFAVKVCRGFVEW